jgi:hypothetical protein
MLELTTGKRRRPIVRFLFASRRARIDNLDSRNVRRPDTGQFLCDFVYRLGGRNLIRRRIDHGGDNVARFRSLRGQFHCFTENGLDISRGLFRKDRCDDGRRVAKTNTLELRDKLILYRVCKILPHSLVRRDRRDGQRFANVGNFTVKRGGCIGASGSFGGFQLLFSDAGDINLDRERLVTELRNRLAGTLLVYKPTNISRRFEGRSSVRIRPKDKGQQAKKIERRVKRERKKAEKVDD